MVLENWNVIFLNSTINIVEIVMYAKIHVLLFLI